MEKIEFIEMMKSRTKKQSIEVIRLYDSLKKTDSIRIIGKQLIRSTTSTAANYRAACIARSQAEFFAKMSIVTEEADESIFWLEMLEEIENDHSTRIFKLKTEALEISKVMSRARKNSRNNNSIKSLKN